MHPETHNLIRRLSPSPLVRRFANQIVRNAAHHPILDLGCGRGRHTFLLAWLGADVICLDKDLRNFKEGQVRVRDLLGCVKIRAIEVDVLREQWPFGPSTLGGIVDVHFLVPQLFDSLARSLLPGSYLLVETAGGQGGNYLELPPAGRLRANLSTSFEFEFYRERKVGPREADAVSVGLLAKKKVGGD